MRKYNAYKPSGIEWIGDIPEKWETIKLKFLTSYNDDVLAEKTNDSHIINYVEISDVNCSDGVVNTTEYAFKDAPSRARRITKKNDVIISTVRTYLKAIAKISEDGLIVSTGFIVLRPQKIYNQFLSYSALSESFISDVISQSVGVSYPAIKASQIVNIKIPIPSYAEQVAIASYLEAKCAKIDNVLSVQQKRIELLKELKQSIITNAVTKGLDKNVELKPSGIEWIGDIPEKWETKRLKYVGTARNGLTYDQSDVVEEGVLVLRSSNIQDGKLDYNDNVYVKRVSDELMVKSGDIIICSRNGSLSLVGKCAYIDKDINASFGAFMLRFRGNLHSRYSYYLLSQTISQYKGLFSTTTVNQLTLDTLNNMWVAIPPKDEQIIIASYLDKKCSAIDNQISKIERQIELLKEYKQSIITECVTGKRKVC